ncbi:hypothetical protein [Streptomyces sp. CB03911]|uniref:hypothetical protein n=1 Tax=Streptomycetaceae TaxID=2062 RepID=UPI0009392044|nr:hypothetical protein [Streptomyces sp. CB03911]OKI20359.1 hypothetical protein A6A07_37135 [Streptomyces sp. CB03911]
MNVGPVVIEPDHGRPRGMVVRVAWPSMPTCAAVLSNGSVGSLLVSGTIAPESPLVWPLVTLALGAMAYDLGARALGRQACRFERASDRRSWAGQHTRPAAPEGPDAL